MSIQRKGMALHMLLPINCGLGCFRHKQFFFLLTNSQLLSGLMTAQAVNPLSLFRDFPGKGLNLKKLESSFFVNKEKD
jgi:hypothetical protein